MTKLDKATRKREPTQGYSRKDAEAFRILRLRGVLATVTFSDGQQLDIQVDDPPQPPRTNFTAWVVGTGNLLAFDLASIRTVATMVNNDRRGRRNDSPHGKPGTTSPQKR